MKTTPFGKSTLIDPLRAGGTLSMRRHNFLGQEVQAPAPARVMAAPEDNVTQPERTAIQEASAAFLSAAQREMNAVIDQAAAVLDINNQDFGDFPSRAEALGQTVREARAINTLVQEFGSSSVSPYLSEEEVAITTDISDMRSELDSAVENAPFAVRPPSDIKASDDQVEERLSGLKKLSRDADILVVEAEASGVPILEPLEKQENDLSPLIGIGLLAAAAYALYEYLK